jgi:hypothetical protein
MRAAVASTCLVVALGSGCRAAPAGSPTEPTKAGERGAEPSAEVEREPLPVRQGLDLVPAGAPVVAEIPDWHGLLVRAGRDRLFGAEGSIYGELTGEVRDELGVDPFDAAELARVGVDPDGPLGAAVLDLHDEAFMVWFRVRSPEALRSFVAGRLGAEQAETVTLGDATLVRRRGDDELTIVLRGGFCALVFVDRPERARRAWVDAVARGDPREAVGQDGRHASVRSGLPADADLRVSVDPRAIGEQLRRSEEPAIAAEAPPPAGASAEEFRAWEQRRRDMQLHVDAQRRARAREDQLRQELLGDVGLVATAVSLPRGRVDLHSVVQLGPRSQWRALWGTISSPAILRTLEPEPVLVLGGRLDPTLGERALDLLAQLQGAAAGELDREVRAELGVSPRELAGLLAGEVGLSVSFAGVPARPDSDRLARAFGVSALASVRDPAAARRTMETIAARLPAGLRRDPKLDAWVIDFGGWHPLLLGVVDSFVVLGSDRETWSRLRASAPPVLDKLIADPAARVLLERPGVAALYLDARLPVFADLNLPDAAGDVVATAEVEPPEHRAVPHSSRWKRVEQQHRRVVRRLQSVQRRRGQDEVEQAKRIGRDLGTFAGHAEVGGDGLVLDGTWRFGVSDLAALIEALERQERERFADITEEMALQERRFALEEELRRIRAEDVQEWQRRRGP